MGSPRKWKTNRDRRNPVQVVLATLLLPALPGLALILVSVAQADTSTLRIREQKDEPGFYELNAFFTTVDSDSNGVFGPAQIAGGTNWSWTVSHRCDAWYWGPPPAPCGASNATITLDGTHLHGPHPEDAPNNPLVMLAPPGEFVNLDSGEFVTETNAVDHPAAPETHRDVYGFGAWICTRRDSSQLRLTGDLRVFAQHQSRGSYDGWLKWITFGCNELPISSVAFQAGSGTLTIQGGPVNVLNRRGETTTEVDPLYAGDPILGSDLWVSQLQYLGPDGDGGYRFGPGFLEVNDPEAAHHLSGMFATYIFYERERDTDPHGMGLFDRFSIRDKMESPEGPSPFLQDFVATNLFGDELEEAEWMERAGTAVAIVPVLDLVELSNGFTQSTPWIPAAIIVACAVGEGASSHAPSIAAHPVCLLTGPTPNPVTDHVGYQITLARASRVQSDIFDVLGRPVASILDRQMEAGAHPLRWVLADRDGRPLDSGIYVLRVRAGGQMSTRRMAVVR